MVKKYEIPDNEELRTVILQSLDDEKHGKVHSHAEVQSMINARIEAWRKYGRTRQLRVITMILA